MNDLRNKTAFDFTDDPEILKAIDLDIDDKENFINFALPVAKAFSILDYAEYIGDKQLISAVAKEFEKEFSEFFNE
ncbi:hypothetical protein M2132_000985 [Dysgonomonas sp. PH5-45]|uniref:hypothetical protein n=1 Tax=unclassified Dysgonomonas TaxID=2630389 RepID=UPI00247376AE|nr:MULTISPECIES: hypothetical protein [unclassified Dysgonomonas]MDH6354657.1 hypothetical protein [Dysgonomonas sp. PH5-45]MDH6387554.1 hypothetical protein [Dysgonomonas sp. PH5-37]